MPRPTTNLKPTKIIYKSLDASPLIDKQFVSIAVKKKNYLFGKMWCLLQLQWVSYAPNELFNYAITFSLYIES